MKVQSHPLGTTADGHAVTRYTLTNANGLSAEVMNLGASLLRVFVPDRDGKLDNITLHFRDLHRYETQGPYFGATVGRFANRIAGATFALDGQAHTLPANDSANTLHGGRKGFDKHLWQAQPLDGQAAVEFSRTSDDGEEGFPSRLDVAVTYTLTDENELRLDYTAKNAGDKATVVNLTNHAYWNLGGGGDVLGDVLTLRCDRYLPVGDGLIPTGEMRPVDGTPFDFREPQTVGGRIGEIEGGYDHCYLVAGADGTLRECARVRDPASGRAMTILTTEPAVQLYTGNFLDGTDASGGHGKNAALCLETQHLPDSPNRPEFPSTVLAAGDTFESTTVHCFTVEAE